jgi:HD-GYP domain-containing protein (c-di-GMP phosphodiesterase class II)
LPVRRAAGERQLRLGRGAGEVGIPDTILNKPGPLDATEWEFMRQHTILGERIPLGARIVAVCDAYEAMTADRAYRKALLPHAARQELSANAGSQFDPAVVAAFLAAVNPDQAEPVDATSRTAVDATAAHIRALLKQPAVDADACPVATAVSPSAAGSRGCGS